MPIHDIIDNRNELLVDHINRILSSSDYARFVVGYFFLSGFKSIAKKLSNVQDIRLLVGNTSNRQTLEQLAEGYRRLELVKEAAESQNFRKRSDARRMAEASAKNVRETIELMDQTDQDEAVIRTLAQLIEEKRLKVRVYTRGRLHAKAYIFDYGQIYDGFGEKIGRQENGIAIVGSSNLTLSGISHNTELNVVVQGNQNHSELVRWFDQLWDESQDFDEALMDEMSKSWAMAQVRPYDIYMKTIYTLVRDRIEGEEGAEILWDDEIIHRLADFQKVAVRQAIQIIKDYGGAFISDVVGLGKSYMGAAVIKHYERTFHARPLIICPAALVDMWEGYNEAYQLNARVLSTGYLREDKTEGTNILLTNPKYRDRDFVLVDESHNFRYPDTQRYKLLQQFLAPGRRCCFLTATPRNKTAWDVYHQIKLFHQDDKTEMPIDPPDLRAFFKLIDKETKKLPELLANLLIRRTRNHILRWYGFDAKTHQPINPSDFRSYFDGKRKAYVIVGGRHQFFPKRQLETIQYSIEDTYQGLYQKLRAYLGKGGRKGQPMSPTPGELTYARYGLWHYVKRGKQNNEPYTSLQRAGVNLRGLIRIMLFKRFESSVYAFKQTIQRLVHVHELFLKALGEGIVPAGEDAQRYLYESDYAEEIDFLSTLRELSQTYNADDFDCPRLTQNVEHDIAMYREILTIIDPITPGKDAKLQTLKSWLSKSPLKKGKRLIFTQYADTASYLYENLNPGNTRDDMDVIFSGDKSKARAVGRFAPKANPEYQFASDETELFTLVATDVLAEGLNLQDGDKIVNYDLHWNPVRLIQRFGRIDRIGSEYDEIFGFNFLPELGIERNLGLTQTLKNRIQEIHDTIGEDTYILDASEQLNEDAMYAIYEKQGGQLDLFEDEEEFLDLNEAEELLRQLRSENPGEYERIANLRDGIRTGRESGTKGLYVFCEAGNYQQLFLIDENGKYTSRDIPRVLGTIKCDPALPSADLPKGYNKSVMRVKNSFAEEVKHRWSEQKHTLSLRLGQRYLLRELRVLYGVTDDDEDLKAQINLLEKVFRGPLTNAVHKELNILRRNGVTGRDFLKSITEIYHQHNLKDFFEREEQFSDKPPIPKIICSEALK